MENYDLVILGAGCAGLSAGICASRAGLSVLTLDVSVPGGQAATTSDINNYPGIPDISGPELIQRMTSQAEAFGAKIRTETIKSAVLAPISKEITTSSGCILSRAVIIATGASPKKAGFQGEEEFRGRGVGYCATCDGYFFRGRDIFVIGGGNSAAEEAVFLTRFGKTVTVLVRKDRLRCSRAAAERLLNHPKINVRFNTQLLRVDGDTMLHEAEILDNATGKTELFRSDEGFGVFVFVGQEPNSAPFRGQLEPDKYGYLITDERLHTSIPGVFAAGDVRQKSLRQIVTAASDGAIAAAEAERFIDAL